MQHIIQETLTRHPELSSLSNDISRAVQMIVDCHLRKNKVLTCGNGGSAADSEHIVGELMKRFRLPRPLDQKIRDELIHQYGAEGERMAAALEQPVEAIALTSQSALLTAFSNDVAADLAFAQQVLGYGKPGDLLIGLSTSGHSANVLSAMRMAKLLGMRVLGFTGCKPSEMDELCDLVLHAPDSETYLVQESHEVLYHLICQAVEFELFGKADHSVQTH